MNKRPKPGQAAQTDTSAAFPAALEAASIVHDVGAGEPLFMQGDAAAAIYKVESGQLRLVRRTIDGHLVILHTARPGEFFAEAALFADAYHCDAIAAAPSRVRAYPKTKMKEAMRSNPAFAEAFTAGLARQLQDLRSRMELRNIRSARERVLQYLRLRAGGRGRRIAIDGQLQDIAAEIGITREAFYRTLAALEAEGKIVRTGNSVQLNERPGA